MDWPPPRQSSQRNDEIFTTTIARSRDVAVLYEKMIGLFRELRTSIDELKKNPDGKYPKELVNNIIRELFTLSSSNVERFRDWDRFWVDLHDLNVFADTGPDVADIICLLNDLSSACGIAADDIPYGFSTWALSYTHWYQRVIFHWHNLKKRYNTKSKPGPRS